MFVLLPPDTLYGGNGLQPVGDGFYFNINRIGWARFRSSNAKDQAGLGASADQIRPGTPCMDVSIEGSVDGVRSFTLYFPGPLRTEYERLQRILHDRRV